MPMESILETIKKMLGIEKEYDAFDVDIITAINSAIFTLSQYGVGPREGFMIYGYDSSWSDFLGDRTDLEAVKSYIYIRTRLIFDPPSTSFVIDALSRQASEFEWRLNIQQEAAKNGSS